ARARSARSLRMTTPRGFGNGKRKGGWFPSLPSEASEPVILSAAGAKDLLSPRCEGAAVLSAAGAKDLLSHRCEGPADRKDPQARRTCFGEGGEEPQVLRLRAFRAPVLTPCPPLRIRGEGERRTD